MDPTKLPQAPVETADTLRAKAKTYMMQAGIHGLIADRIVEYILAAAVLEMSNLLREAIAEAVKEDHHG